MLRIGQGYDVHRLKEGRRLVLGGVEIPFELGLDGHSDSDVLTHAIMDALLGALALGDIGQHFPDTDPQFKGADSVELLRHVVQLLKDRSTRVVNVDTTVVAEAPKLAPHIGNMREVLADALAVQPSDVSIKATTAEKMGAFGRREGIAAQAVVLVSVSE